MSLVNLLDAGSSPMQQRDKIYGVVVGIVRDIKDPEKLGQVKVDFPWLADEAEAVVTAEDEDRAHSYWARIATLMAGNGRGSYFIPEVGDEVLVAFEYGDLDRPIVLGALWNADDPPPETMDGEGQNNIRAITSRSGHKIILNDSDDELSITIVDQSGENSIFIDSANNAMEIKAAGDLSLEAGGNMNLTAKGKITIDAGQDIVAQTKTNLEVKATGNGKMESTGPLEIKSSAPLTVQGALVKIN